MITNYLKLKFGMENKTVLITGGSGVLCGEIAKGFAFAGANVVLCGRSKSNLDEKVDCIVREGILADRIATIESDLLREENIKIVVGKSIKKFGKIDILVNGIGGSSKRCSLIDLDTGEFEEIMKVNLLAGCVLPSKYIAKYWIENEIAGTIINIASMGSFRPLSGGWAYSAAKAAVVNQTMAMAKEFAPYKIRVNAIAPGFFLGKQNKNLLIKENGELTERGKNIVSRTPMNRFGNSDEVASAVVFLASGGASFITGVTLPIDGGYLCDSI